MSSEKHNIENFDESYYALYNLSNLILLTLLLCFI